MSHRKCHYVQLILAGATIRTKVLTSFLYIFYIRKYQSLGLHDKTLNYEVRSIITKDCLLFLQYHTHGNFHALIFSKVVYILRAAIAITKNSNNS